MLVILIFADVFNRNEVDIVESSRLYQRPVRLDILHYRSRYSAGRGK